MRELAFKRENIPFPMRDRPHWATPVLPSADAYAAVGHREDLDVGQNGADGDHQRALHQNAGLGISFRHFGFAPLKIVHKNKMRPQQQTQRLRL